MGHDHDQPPGQAGDVGSPTRARQLDFGRAAVRADGGGVQVAMPVDLGAADEAGVDLAGRER